MSLVLALGIAASLQAQTPIDSGVTLIHAGRVFDSEHGVFLSARDILVRRGMIDSVAEHIGAQAGRGSSTCRATRCYRD
jgi:hypothetical protein